MGDVTQFCLFTAGNRTRDTHCLGDRISLPSVGLEGVWGRECRVCLVL